VAVAAKAAAAAAEVAAAVDLAAEVAAVDLAAADGTAVTAVTADLAGNGRPLVGCGSADERMRGRRESRPLFRWIVLEYGKSSEAPCFAASFSIQQTHFSRNSLAQVQLRLTWMALAAGRRRVRLSSLPTFAPEQPVLANPDGEGEARPGRRLDRAAVAREGRAAHAR